MLPSAYLSQTAFKYLLPLTERRICNIVVKGLWYLRVEEKPNKKRLLLLKNRNQSQSGRIAMRNRWEFQPR